jgi:hypothetical protein
MGDYFGCGRQWEASGASGGLVALGAAVRFSGSDDGVRPSGIGGGGGGGGGGSTASAVGSGRGSAVVAGNEGFAPSVIDGRNLGRELASEEQMASTGVPIIGAGTTKPLRDSDILAGQYGGNPGDWAKMASRKSYRGADGFEFETHWYENTVTGQKVEYKTKITSYGRDPANDVLLPPSR